MLEFTEEEKKLQEELSWLATRLKELAFEIEVGKYKSVKLNHKNLTLKIGNANIGVIGHEEIGFELTIRVLY